MFQIVEIEKRKKSSESGISLIQILVLVVVTGLLMVPIFRIIDLERKDYVLDKTTGSLIYVRDALVKYAVENGRYPLPADRNLAPDNANFGVEWATPFVVCSVVAANLSPCRVGAGATAVLVGDVPVTELGINMEHMVDGWGGKLTYSISEVLTATGTFSDDGGVIQITRRDDTDEPQTNSDAHFALVSHGMDGLGSFSLYGQARPSCLLAPVDNRDTENCLYNDNVYTTNSEDSPIWGGGGSTENKRMQYLTPGVDTYYDDYIEFVTTTSAHIWTFSSGSQQMESKNPGNILIGEHTIVGRPAVAEAKLEVIGDVSTDVLSADRLCPLSADPAVTNATATCPTPVINAALSATDPYEQNVFNPAVIALGTKDSDNYGLEGGGIRCKNQGLRGIANSDEDCTGTFPSSFAAKISSCASGTYPKGIKADGTLDCIVPAVAP